MWGRIIRHVPAAIKMYTADMQVITIQAVSYTHLYIARRFHRISNLGKILDPVADKLTQAAMLICLFTRFPHVLLLIAIMAGKELYMVVSGCLVIQKTGKVHGADWHGKIRCV